MGATNVQKKAYIVSPETTTDPTWYMDNSASNQVTNNLANLNFGTEYKENDQLVVDDGSMLLISHIGHSILPIMHIPITNHLLFKHVLCVLTITTKNLISIFQLVKENNINILFYKRVCVIKDKL